MSRLATFCGDRRGGMSILAGGVLFILMLLATLSIDFGMLYGEKERLQGAVDRAALKAVTDPRNAAALAAAVVADNIAAERLVAPPQVTLGRYPPAGYTLQSAAALAPGQRFAVTSTGANALRVTAQSTAPLFFARLIGKSAGEVSASAVALNAPVTQIMAGTQFASFDPGVAASLDPLLTALLGRAVTLHDSDFATLLAAQLPILALLDAVIAAQHLGAKDYVAALSTPLTLGEIFDAMQATFDDPAAAAVLDALRAPVQGLAPVTLGAFLLLDETDPRAAAGASLSALGVVSAAIAAVNAGQSLAVPASLALGAATAKLWAHVVEVPQFSAVGGVGITVRTAQVRLYIDVEALNALNLPLLGNLVSLRLPLYVEVGGGEAIVTGLACAGPDTVGAEVDVEATPGLVALHLGEIDPDALAGGFAPEIGDATLVSALGGSITVQAHADATIAGATADLTFRAPFTAANYQVAPLAGDVRHMTADLVAGLVPSVNVLNLPLIGGAISLALPPRVADVLGGLAPLLDTLFGRVQALFGLEDGYMKVADTFLRCSRPMLAGQ